MIPVTGNEYEQHIEAKRRILQAMIDLDFKNIEIEKSLPCEGKSYIVDCYGEYFGGAVKLAVEILGKKGHNTKYAYHKDKWRKKCLEDKYKGLRLISLPAANLGADMPDRFVQQELLEAATK